MQDLWDRLQTALAAGRLKGGDRELARKLAKALNHLSDNPFHAGLQSHEIGELSNRYGQKVFESYLENNTPSAGRLFWVYGPERRQVTVIALEPHPEAAKRGAYGRVKLSALPDVRQVESAGASRKRKR